MKATSTVAIAAALLCVAMFHGVSQAEDFICPRQDNTTVIKFYPDTANCSCYYECDNKVARHMTCPPGLEFNADKEVCDFPDYAGCSVTSLK